MNPMIDCIKCGFENPDRHKFCQNCGFNLVSDVPSPKSPENNPGVNTTIQLGPTAQVQTESTTSWQDPPTDKTNDSKEIAVVAREPISEAGLVADAIAASIEPNPESNIVPDLTEAANQNASIDLELGELDVNAETDDVAIALDLANHSDGKLEGDRVEDLVSDLDNEINDLRDRLTIANPNTSDLVEQTSNALQLPVIAKTAPSKVTEPKLRLISMRHAGLTNVGKQRTHNEDNFAISSQIAAHETPNRGALITSRGLFVLCDGMGGHAGGEVASSMAIEQIVEKFRPFWGDRLPGSKKLKEIILTANQSIFELNENELRRDVGRMGTTLVLMSIYNSEVAIAHVGDSRIYQITASGIKQITRDHEVANRLIDQGIEPAEALSRHDAHQLTQALGPYANHQLEPAISFSTISEPTLFLLCSDGLCDNDLVEQNWETYLLPLLAADADLGSGVKQLIDLANTINGHDNITAILVNCQVESVH
jgi:serine/threonine protein phosphatase PrpC